MAARKPKTSKRAGTGTRASAGGKAAPAPKKRGPRTSAPPRKQAQAPAAGKRAPRAEPAQARHPLMKTLYAEHRHIASVMQLLAEQLAAIEAGEPADSHVIYETMDYMVTWPDRYHHPREDLIYSRAAELDAGLADSVDTLQRDHDNTAAAGREVLEDIEGWRDGDVSAASLVKKGRAYIDHMYSHMNSEEELVFPQIESTLGAQDWRELAEDDHLRPVGDPVFGYRVQREYRNLARKLRRNIRRGVERGTLVEWLSVEALMESLDVLAMARESIRGSASDHLQAAWEDGVEMFRESALTAPWRCAGNNVRLGKRLLQEVVEISRDALDDLSRVNRERKARIDLMDS